MSKQVENEFREELLASLAKMLTEKVDEDDQSMEQVDKEISEQIARILTYDSEPS